MKNNVFANTVCCSPILLRAPQRCDATFFSPAFLPLFGDRLVCFTNCVNTHSCRWQASLLRTMWIWSGAARSENATTKAAPALHTDEGSRSQVLVCASGKHVGWQTPTLLTAEVRRHAENSISPSAPLPEFDPSALSRRADCQELSRKLTHDGNKQ